MIEIRFDNTRYHQQREMRIWCEDNFGDGRWGSIFEDTDRWMMDGAFGNTSVFFRDEEDANWFILRWL